MPSPLTVYTYGKGRYYTKSGGLAVFRILLIYEIAEQPDAAFGGAETTASTRPHCFRIPRTPEITHRAVVWTLR